MCLFRGRHIVSHAYWQDSVSISRRRPAGLFAGWLRSNEFQECCEQAACAGHGSRPALRRKRSRPAPAPPPPPTIEQQRVQLLIQQVEAAYALGEADYRKGRLPEAKVEFDRAVDLMLTSGIDIKGNAELQDEFDRIVDGVNALEMDALKQGNGFAPKEEPTPADVARM